MVKKIAALAGAGALLLSVAVPVFGIDWFGWGNDVDIHNSAKVYTKVETKADSGDNRIGGKYVFGGVIRTGDALAGADVYTDVNSSSVGCDGCDGDVDIHNRARVYTKVETKADSGDNRIGGKCVGGGRIVTGTATAGSLVTTIVNYSAVGL